MVVTAFRYRIAPPPAGGRRDVSPYYSGVKPRLQDAGPLRREKTGPLRRKKTGPLRRKKSAARRRRS